MKNKFIKLMAAFSLCALVINSSRAIATNIIYDAREQNHIASGVTHVNIERFTQNGWIDIEVLKLDTKNMFSSLTPLISSEGVSKKSTLSTMINTSDAVAGVNGDFFENTQYPMALGSLYGNDQLILTTPEAAFARNSFFITKDGIGGVGNITNNITVKNATNGNIYSVNALNKVSKPYSSISMLDNNWGTNSPGKNLGSKNVEVLIANGKVTEKRVGGASFSILPGTFVLTQVGDNLDSLNVGDSVTVNYGSYSNLKFSIGGGNILVKDGSIPENPKFSKTRAPRTAIGINKANSEILLVTIDGRNNSSIGMTEKELADYMKSIGCYQALNLDGGGSTTMGIKYSGDESTTVVNSPSGGSERAIVSGVGIKTNAPISEPAYIKIIPSDKEAFIGFSYPIEVGVYDQYHNKLSVDLGSINISSDVGNISGSNFSPTTKGKGSISASYQNAQGSVEINVHSEIKELILDVNSLQMSPGKIHIFETIYGKDDEGYLKKIHSSQVQFSISEELGTLEGNKFTAGEGPSTGVLTANYNGIIRNIPVSVGSEKQNIFGFENIEKATVTTTPDDDSQMTAAVFLDDEAKDENQSTGLVYSISNTPGQKTATINYADEIGLNNAQYIGLSIKGDNKGGKIRGTFRDQNGKSATIDLVNNINFEDWKYIEASIPTSLSGNIYLDKIALVMSGDQEVVSTIKFDGLISGVKLPLNWELSAGSTILGDPRNYQIEDQSAAKISITSLNKNGNNGNKISAMQNKDVVVIFNGASTETLNQINAKTKFNGNDVFNIKTASGVGFITVQTNKSGIRSANANQWKPFINAMKSSDYSNIVIMMQHNPEEMVGTKEKELFFNTVKESIRSGKTVFIVSPGNSDSVEMRNGYRSVKLSGQGNGILDINVLNGNLSYVLKRVE